MTTGVGTIIFPVTDLAAAKAVFTRLLGVEPAADSPYYVGYDAPGQHIGLDPNGHKQGMTDCTAGGAANTKGQEGMPEEALP